MNTLPTHLFSNKNTHPVKVIQFGSGHFLRGFADWVFQVLTNQKLWEGKVVIVQSVGKGATNKINEQDGLYHLFLKGYDRGIYKEDTFLIDVIDRCVNPNENPSDYFDLASVLSIDTIISNTTEVGIVFNEHDKFTDQPAATFPGKLTQLMYRRFQFTGGDLKNGFTIIPCELINNNGSVLKNAVLSYARLWNLGEDFIQWIEKANAFHNTLVDRIVPGYPTETVAALQQKIGYRDELMVVAEQFHLWVIEGDEKLDEKFGFSKSGLNVLLVDNIQPYRETKVRILNGAHTAMLPVSLLYGNTTVQQTIENPFTGDFVSALIFNEIIPTLDLPKVELVSFANQVMDRFKNPSIVHLLSSIALNSISKFKVRNLPSLQLYWEKRNSLPFNHTFSMACLLRFYKGEWNSTTLPVNDEASVVAFFKEVWKAKDYLHVATQTLKNETLWGADLALEIPLLPKALATMLEAIDTKGIEESYTTLSSKVIDQFWDR
jgi:tagaturonate reductase